MAQDKEVTANRTYKSSVFIMVFQEKKELLELYNAVSGKHYEDPEELEAVMLNIRPGHNQRLMEASRTLREYAEFVERVRKYAKTIVLNEAVERAVTECIAEFAYLANIRNLIKNTGWSAAEAMKAIGVPEEKWQEYEKKLKESQK